MLGRIGYTVKQLARCHRQVTQAACAHVGHITQLDAQQLHQEGIRVLCLDFDGVLSHHGAKAVLPEVDQWLRSAMAVFPPSQIYILSNKPSEQRQHYFLEQFPGIHFIAGFRKKPYPDGLNEVVRLASVKPDRVLMVDDRLATGILAACIAGTESRYIDKPYAKFSVIESFFAALRFVERLFLFKK